MSGGRPTREQAIAAASNLMDRHGFTYGPCLTAKELLSSPTCVWAIEFAHHGVTAPSATTDPASIEVQISIDGDDVAFLEPWWNQRMK